MANDSRPYGTVSAAVLVCAGHKGGPAYPHTYLGPPPGLPKTDFHESLLQGPASGLPATSRWCARPSSCCCRAGRACRVRRRSSSSYPHPYPHPYQGPPGFARNLTGRSQSVHGGRIHSHNQIRLQCVDYSYSTTNRFSCQYISAPPEY